VTGPHDAPPIVFLHAASYTRKLWLMQTRALAGEFRTVAPDLPGHGTRAGETFTFAAAISAVRAAMDGAGIGRAVLVGVSLGGCVGMACAAQYPERVAGLVLSGCTFDPCRPLARAVLTGEGRVFPRGASVFTRGLSKWLRANVSPSIAEEMIDAGTYWHGAAQAVRAMRGVDFRARLSVFPGPALILNGARDWVHRTSEAAYARAAQDARVEIIPSAGHVPCLDNAEAYTDAVRRFARSLSHT